MSLLGRTPPDFSAARAAMVALLRRRGIADELVLAAMGAQPREDYVPRRLRAKAYEDRALAIGHGATISQPYVTAVMLEALAVQHGDRVLEIGAGSGCVTALLSALGAQVWSVELDADLHDAATERLNGVAEVTLRVGDGALGWPEAAPFDACLAAAAAEEIPPAWLEQLRPGGRLIAPVGRRSHQRLILVKRSRDDSPDICTSLLPVRFVPLRR